jgi:hypothetical protein
MKRFAELTIPTTKPGYAIAAQPRSKSPVGGAAAGRSCCVTATVKTRTPIVNVIIPNQVIQPSFEKVRMEEHAVINIADTRPNTAVHCE